MVQQLEGMTPEQKRQAVAGATVPCAGCYDCMILYDPPGKCKGTGRVFALPDAVRLRCNYCDGKGISVRGGKGRPLGEPCEFCQGRGWNASTDLVAWEKTIFKKWPDALIEKQGDKTWLTPYYEKTNKRFGPGGFSGLGVGLDALVSALAHALVVRGTELCTP